MKNTSYGKYHYLLSLYLYSKELDYTLQMQMLLVKLLNQIHTYAFNKISQICKGARLLQSLLIPLWFMGHQHSWKHELSHAGSYFLSRSQVWEFPSWFTRQMKQHFWICSSLTQEFKWAEKYLYLWAITLNNHLAIMCAPKGKVFILSLIIMLCDLHITPGRLY